MQAIEQALWSLLSADSGVQAIVDAKNKGVWHLRMGPGGKPPVLVFTEVIGHPDYAFQSLSSKRFVYQVQAYASDSDTATGQSIASALKGAAETALTDAALAITGYNVLVCQPYGDLPQTEDTRAAERGTPTYSDGLLLEIIVSPS
jgi:hypothetical protein